MEFRKPYVATMVLNSLHMSSRNFLKRMGLIKHITSSPHYPQSNGQVERMVQSIKSILKKSVDPHLAILSYRATPMQWCGLSPSELSMGRKIRTTIPQITEHLIPKWPYLPGFQKANISFKGRQKENYDSRHRVKEQVEISEGSDVWITTNGQRLEGQVSQSVDTPRSYVIVTPRGELRRNRTQLNVAPAIARRVEWTI